MGASEDIRATLDMSQIASLLGTDEQSASSAVDQALGSLVSGLSGNADREDGALDLARALGDHAGGGAWSGVVDPASVDTQDGQKIVQHVFGGAGQPQQFSLGGEGSLVSKLLPILAPIVMGYLARRLQDQLQSGGGGGGLGDLLGGLLGGRGGVSGQEPVPQPPAAQPSPGGGPFHAPNPLPGGGLRMDDSSAPSRGTSQQPPPQVDPGGVPVGGMGGGGMLGQLLKDLLGGR